MNSRIESRRFIYGMLIAMLVGGCWPALNESDRQASALLAELNALAADRSSMTDSECGVVALACGAPQEYLVYSRASVDEDLLLEKVQQYNELVNFINREYHVPTACPVLPVASGARSENGVCVAVPVIVGSP